MDGTYILGVILTIVGGIALAVQSGVNSSLGIGSGSKPFSSVVSFATGLLVCVLYFIVDTQGLHHQLPSAAGIRGTPWWAWIGGALGAYYVIIVIIFAQKLGAGTLVAIFVCAQLIASIVLDLTGLVGFQRRAFSWQRWVGAALMVAGVVLVTHFSGTPVAAVEKQTSHTQGVNDSSSNSRHLAMELGHIDSTVAPAAAAGVKATAQVIKAGLQGEVRDSTADLWVTLQDKV
eukprot:GHUV01013775.1.p1 GENE.GHUV01013775.1~~GHUV01013775.1.p1  ORF type:complete len:232 (+),score=45.94 GHUV01013775.1:613-1308(+)